MTTTTETKPQPRKQRGAPYYCEACAEHHKPQTYTDTGKNWQEMTPEEREAYRRASDYAGHKDRASGTERGEAIKRLRDWLKPGLSSVQIVIPHVARSGMSRQMRVYSEDGALCFTYNVALACGLRFNRSSEALTIGGCGMDMTLALIDLLSYTLWPNGYPCPGAKVCHHPRVYDHEKGTRLPHARRHKPDGNWTIKRRTL